MNRFIILVTTVAVSMAAHSQIVINEIMQSNVDCVVDDLNQYPDSWVELYNAGTAAVNLSEYSIGNTVDPAAAWPLPSAMMGPRTYRLVYCDKEADGWHTPFRLESGKDCTLYLFRGNEVVDRLPSGMKKQPAPNIAYGRVTDGASQWGYQLTPTPSKANTGQTCTNKDILGAPQFNIPGQVFGTGKTMKIEITVPDGTPQGTEIRYTTDGSEPTASSIKYVYPISISNTTVIRAKLFCDGYLSPRSTAQSYIKFERELTLPVVSILTDRKHLYDNKFGILVDGTYDRGQKNYEFNWRRPMNFEVFDGDYQHSCINQLGESRVTGGATRGAALKSLGLYANKRFGEKRFNHEFFPEQRPGITDYKSVMLRNAGNDFDYLYMRDAVVQSHMSQYVDIDWQAWRPAIVYINGQYVGMLNFRERSNEDNIYSNYNGLEDIDMVENLYEHKQGNMQEWIDFQDFYNEHGHTYAEYNERLDVLEFINVMILNLYYCNLDFPGNNIVHWKPSAPGGRWRVLVKDTDFSLGLYGRSANYQVFKWLYNPDYDRGNNWAVQYDHTRLFRRLMDDETFNREFIDRFAIYMGDFMNYERTWETWEPMYETIRYEYPYHRQLYNPWWPVYTEELKSAKNWLMSRTAYMYQQISDYYKVGKPVTLKIVTREDGDNEVGAVSFNGVTLSRNTFDGKFFVGRPMTLTTDSPVHWTVVEYSSNGPVTRHSDGMRLPYAIPQGVTKVEITVTSTPDGIVDIVASDADETPAYNLLGLPVDANYRGIVIRGGRKYMQH